jgi:hypothetical protein
LRRIVVIAGLTLAASLVGAVSALGSHSVGPHPRTWFDHNNDLIADAGVNVRPAGSANWTSGRKSRLAEAVNEWDGDTSWHPIEHTTVEPDSCYADDSCHGVWLDGDDPAGLFNFNPPRYPAYNIRQVLLRDMPGNDFYDIEDWDIFFNPSDFSFTYTVGGSTDPDVFDFRGVLTHELGHSLFLIDLVSCSAGAAVETMCGSGNGLTTNHLRSLTTDDINAANILY